MLEKLVYINHQNERFEFGRDGIYVNTHQLRNYEWKYDKRNGRITNLYADISKFKIPIVIVCKTEAETMAAKNKLYAVTEKDVLAEQPGKIVIGDYYMRGFVTKSEKKKFLTSPRFAQYDLTMTSDFPYWIREYKYKFAVGGADKGGQNLDFPFDYPYDFKSDLGVTTFASQSVWSSNFRLIIYGTCTDPEVRISGHLYKIHGDIGANEYLTIDSVTKEIYLTTNIGNKVNRFNDRYRKSYVFEKIPGGTVNVLWDGTFAFDLIIMDERREPKWN